MKFIMILFLAYIAAFVQVVALESPVKIPMSHDTIITQIDTAYKKYEQDILEKRACGEQQQAKEIYNNGVLELTKLRNMLVHGVTASENAKISKYLDDLKNLSNDDDHPLYKKHKANTFIKEIEEKIKQQLSSNQLLSINKYVSSDDIGGYSVIETLALSMIISENELEAQRTIAAAYRDYDIIGPNQYLELNKLFDEDKPTYRYDSIKKYAKSEFLGNLKDQQGLLFLDVSDDEVIKKTLDSLLKSGDESSARIIADAAHGIFGIINDQQYLDLQKLFNPAHGSGSIDPDTSDTTLGELGGRPQVIPWRGWQEKTPHVIPERTVDYKPRTFIVPERGVQWENAIPEVVVDYYKPQTYIVPERGIQGENVIPERTGDKSAEEAHTQYERENNPWGQKGEIPDAMNGPE